MSRFGLVAVFVSMGALHLLDPQGINHYGLATWFSYLLAAIEIVSAILFLLGFDAVNFLFAAIAISGANFHVREGEFALLILPLIPLVLSTLFWFTTRPQTTCTCHLRHVDSSASS